MRSPGRALPVLSVSLLWPGPVLAHAFGARYDLPLPLWMFLAGAGSAVALSFVVLGVRLRRPEIGWRRRLSFSAMPARALRRSLRVLSVALLLLTAASAFLGPDAATGNFAAVFVWVIWWVGLGFFQALLGDLWAVANPWVAIADWARAARSRARAGWSYPRRLGAWPAVLAFLVFAWLELVSDAGEQPRTLRWLILGYSAWTWLGMALFGARAWMENADPFGVAFSLLARFSPLGRDVEGRWELRPWGVGLLGPPVSTSRLVFALTMLATVSFDGFVETPAWLAVLAWVEGAGWLREPLLRAQGRGVDLLALVKTIALVLAPLCFVLVYGLVGAAAGRLGGRTVDGVSAARWLVLSLVPIAIAYHISHYFSYLLLAGQLLIPLLSDPLGRGWDLLGTAGYTVDITIVNAKFVWYLALGAIVTGHICSVFLAHVTALGIFASRDRALASQLPMLVLMVGYTGLSLWILAQPIVS